MLLNNNNDLTPLRILYENYKDLKRVCLINDDESLNCCELKYVISRCRFFVAARTHASIAAYSSRVPTLMIGYSVKSKGIATDLFGTAENYVLPVEQIQSEADLTDAFRWLMKHEDEVRQIYETKLDNYIEKAYLGEKYLREI